MNCDGPVLSLSSSNELLFPSDDSDSSYSSSNFVTAIHSFPPAEKPLTFEPSLVPKSSSNNQLRSSLKKTVGQLTILIPEKTFLGETTEIKRAESSKTKEDTLTQLENIASSIEELEIIFTSLEKLTKKESITEKPQNPQTICCFSPLLPGARFNNIHCPIPTHVEIAENYSFTKPYLHANFVDLEDHNFIAAQYPLEDLSIRYGFWNSCWKYVSLIVDLTNQEDMLKSKMTPYYPIEKGTALDFTKTTDKLTVTHTSQSIEGNFDYYQYLMSKKEIKFESLNSSDGDVNIIESGVLEEQKISRLHYRAWQDHCGLTQLKELNLLIEYIKKAKETHPDKRVLVHCRAGVGRTGTIIICAVIKQMILNGQITPANFKSKLQELILKGREQRGTGFVQTSAQLQTIWMFAIDTFKRM
jgi:protein tyrosine phosphatase